MLETSQPVHLPTIARALAALECDVLRCSCHVHDETVMFCDEAVMCQVEAAMFDDVAVMKLEWGVMLL